MDKPGRMWSQIPALLRISYMILGKLLNVPVPQFPHLQNGGDSSPFSRRLQYVHHEIMESTPYIPVVNP